MNRQSPVCGHIAAALTIFIWGTTFISTKVLLTAFTPLEILFFRFFIGYLALWLAAPGFLKLKDKKTELLFAAAGLCGITLYFLMENFALTMTLAANVSIIISVAPFFTAIFDWLFGDKKSKKPGIRFFAGFAFAMAGIFLLSFKQGSGIQFNPKGDLLALAAAITWATYAVLSKRIGSLGYGTIRATRRTFFYGLLFMVPALFLLPFRLDLSRFATPMNLLNILFLGLGASALCFVTWNLAVRILGSVKTSVYIYVVPVITVITSFLILKEPITWQSGCGIILTLTGLSISEDRPGSSRIFKKNNRGNQTCKLQN